MGIVPKASPDETEGYVQRLIRRAIPFLVLILALLGGFLLYTAAMEREADRRAEESYQQGLADGNAAVRTIEVTPEMKADVSTLREAIAPAAKLAVYEYFYTDSGVYEKNQTLFDTDIVLPFTTDKTVYTYTGTIAAGIHVDQVEFEVDQEARTVTVLLPKPVILYHELGKDGFRYYDIQRAALSRTDLGDFEAFRRALKADQEKKLLQNDLFWQRTRENVQGVLTSLITLSGQVDYGRLVFRWKE